MALSEENQLKVSKILGVRPNILEYQLTLLSTDFTSERQTQVETEIERWDAGAGGKFTKIRPGATSMFADVDPDREKSDIRKNIAIILERPDWANSGSRLQRS